MAAYTSEDARQLRKMDGADDSKMRRATDQSWMHAYELQELEQSKAAEQAKALITAFWEKYGETHYESEDGDVAYDASFEDPYLVLLAHREYKERWPHRPVVVKADLINYRITATVDEMYLLHREQYDSLQQMVDEGLRNLDYEELVYVSEEEWGLIENVACKLKYLAFDRCDMGAWRKLLLSTFPLPWNRGNRAT